MSKSNATHESAPKGARWLFPVILLGAAITAGIVLGALSSESKSGAPAAPDPRPAAQAPVKAPVKPVAENPEATISRLKLDTAGAPSRGPESAPVTLVEFTAFQCGYCARSQATINQIVETYPDQVRHVVKYNPLRNPKAAIASLAAERQGKYWEYRNLLFANRAAINDDNLRAWATEVGLDLERFETDLEDPALAESVSRDAKQAASLGATATPYFFINGRALRGAQPFPAFQKIIDEELGGDLPPTKWVARLESPRRQRPKEDPNKVYKVDVAGAIARGPENAPVTLVEFTAFQCGFCARSQATINQILESYPDQVQHVVKYKPLRDPKAAIASLAADRQGKYWEYRNLLFANQRAINDANLRAWATQVGLDLEQFETDRNDPALAQTISQDSKQAASLGVSGTPTFFINGKKLVGAQPYASFKKLIDAQLAAAGQPPATS